MKQAAQRITGAVALLVVVSFAYAAPSGQRRDRTGTLAGIVLGPGDVPVAGARVMVQAADARNPRALRADAQGKFQIVVGPGLYDVRAYAGGVWSDWERNVLVRTGQRTHLRLRLLPPKPGRVTDRPAAGELQGRIGEWSIPVVDALPNDLALDRQGRVWITLERANQIARFDPATGEWKFYPVPAAPVGLAVDSPGHIWFGQTNAGKIARLEPADGAVVEYAVPSRADAHALVFAPGGALWFTAPRANQIFVLDPGSRSVSGVAVSAAEAQPEAIVLGSDEALWFVAAKAGRLGRLLPARRQIIEFEVPFPNAGPRGLAAVPGAIYYTDFRRGTLGRFELERRSFKEWPSPSGPDARPDGIAVDGDGYVWYCEASANQLVRFDPQTETFRRYTLPSPRSDVRHMATDARGRIWMALRGANKLAVVE